jgi:hypothetical protein
MPELTKVNPKVAQKTIIYGESKTGKSRMAMRLAKYHKLLWFDTEQSLAALLEPDNLDPKYRGNIQYIKLPDNAETPLAAMALNKVFSFKPTKICEVHGAVDCPICKTGELIDLKTVDLDTIIVVDSFTQLVTSWMTMISKGKPEGYKFQFDDWAMLAFYGKKFLSNVQACDKNIIIISRAIEVELEDSTKKLVPEGGSRNFSTTVPGFFDHVVFTHLKGKTHAVGSSTTYTMSAMTGSRTNKALESADKELYTPLELIYGN